MSVNLMGEFNLLIQLDRRVTYGELEEAVMAAGFTEYSIVRQLGEDTTDVQIALRDPDGTLDAHDTLAALASAVAGLDSTGGEGGS